MDKLLEEMMKRPGYTRKVNRNKIGNTHGKNTTNGNNQSNQLNQTTLPTAKENQ